MLPLGLLLLLVPALLTGQTPERRAFALLTGSGDTVMVERWVRTGDRTEALLTMHGRPWYRFLADVDPESGAERLVATAYSPARPRGAAPMSAREVVVAGDSATVRDAASGDVAVTFAVARGSSPLFPASLALLQRMVRRAEREGDIWYNGSFMTPVLVIGAEGPVPDTLALYTRGVDSLRAYVARQQVDLALDDDGLISGAQPSSAWLGLRYVRLPDAEADAPWPDQPVDYSPPPGAPYEADEIRLTLRDGTSLGGTLTLPHRPDGGSVPAVLLLSGSGAQDRDGRMMSGHRPHRELADALARSGIASLRLDDRGVGASTGSYEGFTFDRLVQDAALSLRWLAGRSEVDDANIGVIGHSEGALVALRLARERRLSAMVLMGASASPGREVVAWQQRYGAGRLVRDSPVDRREWLVDSLAQEAAVLADRIALQSPPFASFMAHDPSEDARRVGIPTLVLHGEFDRQVPPDDDRRLWQALKDGGAEVEHRRVAGANHLFLRDTVGDPGLYLTVPDRRLASGVTDAIVEWLRSQWL